MFRAMFRRNRRPMSNRTRLACRRLEDRLAPATFAVTTTADSGFQSLRDAILSSNFAAGADTITFSVPLPATITLSSHLPDITDALTIDGPGPANLTISGNNQDRIFGTSTDKAVIFKDLTVANGHSPSGASGSSKNGAAFHLGAIGPVTIDDCIVKNNAVTGAGGAIEMQSFGMLTITNSTFTNNTADFNGGAIFFQASSPPTGVKLTISNCTFSNNSSSGSGGAVAATETNGGNEVLITGTTFSGNEASASGGAMFITDSATTIRTSTFSANTAQQAGGAMACMATTVIQNSTFSGNDGGDKGGAIETDSALTIQNSTITGNSASVAGGGLYQLTASATITTESTVLQTNTAPSGPDAKTPGTFTATTTAIGSTSGISTFKNGSGNLINDPNIKLAPLGHWGGTTETQRPLPGSSLFNKGSNPAGLTTDQRGSVRVFGAAADIGAVEFHDHEYLDVDTTVDESDGNFGPGDLSLREAVELSNGYTGTAEYILFPTDVFPSGFQTTIALTLGEMVISDSVFIEPFGDALVDAGGKSRIFNLSAASPLDVTIFGMNFANGLAKSGVENDGGAVLIGDDSVSFTDCTFTGNHANAEGGAVGVLQTASDVTFDRCTFTDNSAAGNAGAVNLDSGAGTTFTDCTFTGNTSTSGDGGAVYVTNGAVTIDGTIMNDNSAPAGGAIFISGAGGMTISNSEFDGNSAGNGGGLYFQNNSSVSVTNSGITNNQASISGGGLYVTNGTVTLRNSTLSDNTAASFGGGMEFVNVTGTVTIQNCTITANSAGSGGGGIVTAGSIPIIALESCIVSDNIHAGSPNIKTAGSVAAKNTAITDKTGITGGFTDQGGNITVATDLKLASLADNGGTGLTHALLDGSPCLNKGSNPFALTTDQRGPGFPRDNGTIDMGAYEQPKTFVVTILQDEDDGNLAANDISLREAVGLAEATQDTQDRIEFAVTGGITLVLGQINITDALVIAGNGAVTILGAGTRLFNISISSTVIHDVRISALTLLNGNATGSGTQNGGGINSNNADLTLTAVTLVNCQADDNGGAIYFSPSAADELTIRSCTIANSHAINGAGGGIFASGTVTISDSTFSANTAGTVGGAIHCADTRDSLSLSRCTLTANTADEGGGIYVNAPVKTVNANDQAVLGPSGFELSILDSTLSGNHATAGRGGGLWFGAIPDAGQPALIRNSTLSGNSASSNGGAIALTGALNVATAGTVEIDNSTLTANSAASTGGAIHGIQVMTVALESTIVSGNSAAANPDIATPSVEAKTSAIGNSSGFTFVDLGGNLPFGTNLKLGALQNNGGPTQTHALLVGSPAIDAGSNPDNLANDQRGSGFARVSQKTADIGAVESNFPPTVLGVQVNDGSVQRSMVTKLTVNLSETVSIGFGVAFELDRTGPGAPTGAVNLIAQQSGSNVTLTFFAGGAVGIDKAGSLLDGTYTLTVFASKVAGQGGSLDGNADGVGGDNYTEVGAPATGHNLFRLFGDANGDGAVGTNDFVFFRQSFNSVNATFDFDGDGFVSTSDFAQFRNRFNTSI
jgi:predicted outer membrane repeat protein